MLVALLLDGIVADGNEGGWALVFLILIAVPAGLLVLLIWLLWRMSKAGASAWVTKVVVGVVVLLLALIGGCLSGA